MYSMNGLGDSSREIFFDVQESDVYFDAGDEAFHLPNYKVITRDHTVPLGLVKDSYRTVRNEEVFLPVEEEIINFFDPSLLEEVKVDKCKQASITLILSTHVGLRLMARFMIQLIFVKV